MKIGHRPRPTAPAVIELANGAVRIEPCPAHYTVTITSRPDGSLRIRTHRTVEL